MKTAVCNILVSVCLFILPLLPLAIDVVFERYTWELFSQNPTFLIPNYVLQHKY